MILTDVKEVRKTVRSIFVTEMKHRDTGELIRVFGRYDVIAMNNKGYIPVDQYRLTYEMSDEDFVKYGRLKSTKSIKNMEE